jgi:hypothetical protein
MERSNLKKINEAEGKKQYHVEMSNRFAALEDLDMEVDIISNRRKNTKIAAKESLGY